MLSSEDSQVVREVVIQIDAMLHDSTRRSDANIWRAILTEPPADRDAVREELSDRLYPKLRPLLDDGSLPQPVLAFLSQWFGWSELDNAADASHPPATDPLAEEGSRQDDAGFKDDTEETDQKPTSSSFWPAVIGWIAALIILTAIFSHFSGS